MDVISPLTGNNDTGLIAKLNNKRIIQQYQAELGMNISSLSEEVSIYQCNQSGLRFYHPVTLAGDEYFYEMPAKKDHYYSKWKWEYSVASEFISVNTSLLEIGCGNGYFIKEIKTRKVEATGLEFNDHAIRNALNQQLDVRKESIQKHALSHKNAYDYVCAFQVFEHVPDIREILNAASEVLKPGGMLIFGVPNNNSYIFRENRYDTLNLPPHHILLWDQRSLEYLPAVFPSIRLIKLLFQPGNKIFRSTCYQILLSKKMGGNKFSSLIYKFTRPVVKNLFRGMAPFGPGPTVLAVYQKTMNAWKPISANMGISPI